MVSNQTVPLGKSLLKLEVLLDTAKKSGTAILYINETKVGEVALKNTVYKDAWDGISVGRDDNAPVSTQYQSPHAFTGILKKVTIDFK